PATGQLTLRCAARVRAARARDRLRFRWEVDDEVVRRDAPGDAAGSSELVLPTLAPGAHRALVRVTEDGRATSLVEWSLEVPRREPAPEVAAVTPVRPRLIARTTAGHI